MSKKYTMWCMSYMAVITVVLSVGVVLVTKKVEYLEGENDRQRLEISSLKKENRSINDMNNDSQGYINFLESQNAMLMAKEAGDD